MLFGGLFRCSHIACSKEPCDTEQPFEGVDSQIWLVDTSAGKVHVSDLEGESAVIPQEPVNAGIRLQVELESAARVRRPYVGGGNAGA